MFLLEASLPWILFQVLGLCMVALLYQLAMSRYHHRHRYRIDQDYWDLERADRDLL